LLIAESASQSFSTEADAEVFTRVKIDEWFNSSMNLIVNGTVKKVAVNLFLYKTGTVLKEDDPLFSVLKKVRKENTRGKPLLVLAYPSGVPSLTVMIPCIGLKDEAGQRVLAWLLAVAAKLLGINGSQVRIKQLAELGSTVTITADTKAKFDALVRSSETPDGLFTGGRHKFDVGVEANTVELLAILKLVIKDSALLRRKPQKRTSNGQKAIPVKQVSSSEVRSKIALNLGLNDQAKVQSSYGLQLLKWIINLAVSTTCRYFPGGWINSVRRTNNVKDNESLYRRLGYEIIVPRHNDVYSVIMTGTQEVKQTTAKTSDKGKKGKAPEAQVEEIIVDKLVELNEKNRPEGLSFREWRAACALSLPKLSVASETPMLSQLSKDSLKPSTSHVLTSYGGPKMRELVDSLRRTYGCKMALVGKRDKVKPAHYKITRGELLTIAAHVPLIDADGNAYDDLSKIPAQMAGFLAKLFRYNIPEKKRKAEVEEPESSQKKKRVDVMNIDDTIPDIAMNLDSIVNEGEELEKSSRLFVEQEAKAQELGIPFDAYVLLSEGDERVLRALKRAHPLLYEEWAEEVAEAVGDPEGDVRGAMASVTKRFPTN